MQMAELDEARYPWMGDAAEARHSREENLTEADRAALQKCIDLARADPDTRRRDQIDAMLATRSWMEVAEFASYGCQMRSLNLNPWQCPPSSAAFSSLDDISQLSSYEREAIPLLKRMLKAGVSPYHPSPLQALGEKPKDSRMSA
jgi:hypothetical protein